MSDGNKTIKLGVAFDDVGFRRFKSALREVTSEAAQAFQTLNRSSLAAVVGGNALPGQWGSGGFQQRSGVNSQVVQATKANPLTGGMVQGLQQQQNALKIIASGSKEAMKAMVDATKSAIGDQKRELDSLSKTIDQLGRRYNDLSKSAAELRSKGSLDLANVKSNFATGVAQTMLQNVGALGAGQHTLENLEKTLSTLEKAITGAGGAGRPPPGLGGKGGPPDEPPSKRSAYEIAQTWGSGLKTAGHIGSGIAGMLQHWKTSEALNKASTMSFPNQLLGEMMSGDFRGLMQLQRRGDKILGQYGGQGNAYVGGISDAVANVGAGLFHGATLLAGGGAGAGLKGAAGLARGITTTGDKLAATSGFADSFMGAAGAIHNLAAGGPSAAEMNAIQTGANAERAWNPLEERSIDLLLATAPARVRAGKALRGRHLGAWGIGRGYGLDMGESFGAAEALSRRFGIEQTMGGQGARGAKLLHSVDRDLKVLNLQEQEALHGYAIGGKAAGTGISPEAMQQTLEFYGKERERIEKRGDVYSDGKRGARSLLSMALEAEQRGFSREGAGEMIGTLSQQGGQEAGWEKFKKAIAEGFSRGIKDSNFLEAIGRAAVGASLSNMGLNAGLAPHMSAFISAGVDKDMGRYGIDSSIAGTQGLNDLFGGNSFFKTAQTTAAVKAMGGVANGLGLRALGQTSFTELMSTLRMNDDSQLSKGLLDSGVTLDQAQETARTSLRTMLQTQGGGDPRLAKILAANRDPIEALRAMEATETGVEYGNGKKQTFLDIMGSALSGKQDSAFKTKDAADAALRSLAGFSTAEADVRGNLPAMNADGAAQSIVSAQQAVLQRVMEEEKKYIPEMLKAMKNINQVMDHLADASKDFANPNSGKTFLVKVVNSYPDGKVPPPSDKLKTR